MKLSTLQINRIRFELNQWSQTAVVLDFFLESGKQRLQSFAIKNPLYNV